MAVLEDKMKKYTIFKFCFLIPINIPIYNYSIINTRMYIIYKMCRKSILFIIFVWGQITTCFTSLHTLNGHFDTGKVLHPAMLNATLSAGYNIASQKNIYCACMNSNK